jgi:VIT1/CCC1 family predicted Fe2+/Mn2+ transporter
MSHREIHKSSRIGWLRAGVMGANDGIVSTASLILGVAAAGTPVSAVLVSGAAGLVAGAMSMAAGEYVSVSSQADTEQADRAKEAGELESNPESELRELTAIYEARGLSRELAAQVAVQLTAHGALDAHLRDELGHTPGTRARPVQAALASAAAFTSGGLVPLLAAWIAGEAHTIAVVATLSLAMLVGLGVLAAVAGGAPVARPTLRVLAWGALAMAITSGVGAAFGAIG